MKRLYVALTCLLVFCTPALATDWPAILMPNGNPTADPRYQQAMQRLTGADIQAAQAEVAELNALYQTNSALRRGINLVLYMVTTARIPANDSADALKPIIPTLIADLTDPDIKTREGVMRVIAMLKPQPPAEALGPLISLLGSETEVENVRVAVGAVSQYCETSKRAVLALAAAAAPDQSDLKRATVFQDIGQTKCRDSELVDALAAGLRSNQPAPNQGGANVVLAAAQTAARFGAAAEPLVADLRRIAASNTKAADAAQATLKQLQR